MDEARKTGSAAKWSVAFLVLIGLHHYLVPEWQVTPAGFVAIAWSIALIYLTHMMFRGDRLRAIARSLFVGACVMNVITAFPWASIVILAVLCANVRYFWHITKHNAREASVIPVLCAGAFPALTQGIFNNDVVAAAVVSALYVFMVWALLSFGRSAKRDRMQAAEYAAEHSSVA